MVSTAARASVGVVILIVAVNWAWRSGKVEAQTTAPPTAGSSPVGPAEPPGRSEATKVDPARKEDDAYRRGFLDGFRAGAAASWRPQDQARRYWSGRGDRPWYPGYRWRDRSSAPYWYDREPRGRRPWQDDDRGYDRRHGDGRYGDGWYDHHRYGDRWSGRWTSYRPDEAGGPAQVPARGTDTR